MIDRDFSKEFFQRSWGPDGYYENFSYGVGIDRVKEVMITPFTSLTKDALEIGCGGGVFSKFMAGKFNSLTLLDVIKRPKHFDELEPITYIEAPDRDFTCYNIPDSSMDFVFSYGLFCHLSNEALTEYFKNIHRVLKPSGDFTFMLANYHGYTKKFAQDGVEYVRSENPMLPIGHFYQDEETVYDITEKGKWNIVSLSMIPEHRDICIHLQK